MGITMRRRSTLLVSSIATALWASLLWLTLTPTPAVGSALDNSKNVSTSQVSAVQVSAVQVSADHVSADQKTQETEIEGVTFSNPVTTKWKVTAKIRGGSGPAANMLLTIPVPTEWPEQSVAVAEDEIPTNIANVGYRDLEGGVKQIIAKIPQIRPREEITISMTFLVSTSQINAPQD
ncbi:hypothetical protein N9B44_01915, partial [bacterium]|nr:hypothetical protein [bacterium]